jgi:hypothetical protein
LPCSRLRRVGVGDATVARGDIRTEDRDDGTTGNREHPARVAAMALGAVAVSAPAYAQTPAPPAPAETKPNTGRVSLTAGVDWTTDYYFRGILQEDKDWIFQPYGEISFKLVEGTPAFGNVALTVGLWNSLHGGPTGVDGNNTDPDL